MREVYPAFMFVDSQKEGHLSVTGLAKHELRHKWRLGHETSCVLRSHVVIDLRGQRRPAQEVHICFRYGLNTLIRAIEVMSSFMLAKLAGIGSGTAIHPDGRASMLAARR